MSGSTYLPHPRPPYLSRPHGLLLFHPPPATDSPPPLSSTYLVQKRLDMLPKLLTETLCSLTGKADHFAFTYVPCHTHRSHHVTVTVKGCGSMTPVPLPARKITTHSRT